MAVAIQQVVGQRFEDRFYPHISGVAQSYNFYPIGHQRAEDGVALIALGLGQMIVSGAGGLRFGPTRPNILPQFPTPQYVLRYTQRQFYSLDLSDPIVDLTKDPDALLQLNDLEVAERDGTLALAGSVYCAQDDAIRENLTLPGPRVVTFNNVLRWRAIPLAEALVEVLATTGKAMGAEVEIEFAVDMADWGKPVPAGRKARTPRLYILQARPMARPEDEQVDIDFASLPEERVVCRSRRSLGNGRIEGVRDIVYVHDWDLSADQTRAVAQEIREVDAVLGRQGRRYVLIGPGRWGSSDPSLGIPVDWLHICNARVIVEVPLRGELLEASQGTHFFHNVTAARLGYVTVTPQGDGFLDRAWLTRMSADHGGELVRHIELDHPLSIRLDGRHGLAAIVRAD